MNGNVAPTGNHGIGAGMPFYRGAYQAQMAARASNEEDSNNGGPRYVPPHMRQEPDIIRPESSLSNVSAKTFASQAPFPSNYSYGPAQLTSNMASYNPFITGRGPQPMRQPVSGQGLGHGLTRPGFSGGLGMSGMNGMSGTNGASYNSNDNTSAAHGHTNALAAPTPVRRDSGAPQSHAAYLAERIMAGHADNPYDPDYGNPGPSRRVAPPPAPLALPPQGSPANSLVPKVNGKKVAANTDGNSAAFLGSKKVTAPAWFGGLDTNPPPTIEQAFASLPFIEACRYAVPSTAGVVKIINIPYATSRSEVNAFLGKNTKICFQPAGTGFHAVHIVMDRHSGKTMEAFVEVNDTTEAVWVVNQFQKRVMQNRPGKIGDRVVEVALSDQKELMSTLFPRAKNVIWEGGVPKVDPSVETYYAGVTSTGFIGFLQDEEIVHIQKHAEVPQRSPFATRCMIRTYECLISTLYKYPWFAHEHVLLSEREALFNCTHACVRAMIALLRRTHHEKPDHSKPTINTLIELATAIFVCPGFTEAQKASIATTLQNSGFGKLTDDHALNLRFGGVGKFCNEIPFLALVKQPGVDDIVVEYFGKLLIVATIGQKQFSLADLHALAANQDRANNNSNTVIPFGDVDVDYAGCKSLADAGRAELRYLEKVLGRVLPRGSSSAGYRVGSGPRVSSGSRVGSHGSSLLLQ